MSMNVELFMYVWRPEHDWNIFFRNQTVETHFYHYISYPFFFLKEDNKSVQSFSQIYSEPI